MHVPEPLRALHSVSLNDPVSQDSGQHRRMSFAQLSQYPVDPAQVYPLPHPELLCRQLSASTGSPQAVVGEQLTQRIIYFKLMRGYSFIESNYYYYHKLTLRIVNLTESKHRRCGVLCRFVLTHSMKTIASFVVTHYVPPIKPGVIILLKTTTYGHPTPPPFSIFHWMEN